MFVMVFVGNRISPVVRVCGSFIAAFVICCVLPFTTQYLSEDSGFYADIALIVVFGKPGPLTHRTTR